MATFRTLDDLDVKSKRVLVRADLNVPMKDGIVTDTSRIDRQAPTITQLAQRGARVIVCSHFDRPKGKVVPSMSLAPVAAPLAKAVGRPVAFASDCVGPVAEAAVAKLKDGDVLLLENTRFHAEEEKNDPAFAKQLASLAELYVNDAFGSAHRAHASTEGVTHFIAKSAAGLLMERELEYLGKATENPAKPFLAILGGAKVSDKIGVIRNLLPKLDALIIGGGMAYTFLKAEGQEVGKSMLEADKVELAKELIAEAKQKHVRLLLPVDHAVADKFDASAVATIIPEGQPIPADKMALDIGPATIEKFSEEIAGARTIVWNGPMGVFEFDQFSNGTTKIAEAVADNPGATSIVGGGDSVAAVHKAGVADKITHISTGGGASLEFLEGKKLPGVEALTDK